MQKSSGNGYRKPNDRNNWCFSMVHMEKCKGLKSRSFFFRSHQLKHSLKWYGVAITFCHNPTVCPISLENDTPIKKRYGEQQSLYFKDTNVSITNNHIMNVYNTNQYVHWFPTLIF